MPKSPKDDHYSDKETKERAEQALRGAFKTPPIAKDAERKPRSDKPTKKSS